MLVRKIAEILTMEGAAQKQGRRIQEKDLGLQKNWALWISKGRIQWLGPDHKIPKHIKKEAEIEVRDGTVLPGFVECHTHSVFAGNRSAEFELRNQGASYSEIAAGGGGILSTVRETRRASSLQLLQQAQSAVQKFVNQGVSTLEIKSGYALNKNDEIKMLEVIRRLKGPRVISTFLGAHAKPPEFPSYDSYLNFLSEDVLPALKTKKKNLADRVDIFIEKGFFETTEAAKIYLQTAQKLGLGITIHADQLSLSGGTDWACDLAAQSADHVIEIADLQISRLARSEVTAVLLPAADFYLKCSYPPARKLIDQGARVALATDFNPGTSPTQDLALVGMLARLQMKMSLPEVIAAYTVGAAHALGLSQEVGSLEKDKSADFLITKKPWNELFYHVGNMGIDRVYCKGRKLSAAL